VSDRLYAYYKGKEESENVYCAESSLEVPCPLVLLVKRQAGRKVKRFEVRKVR
jgi:hypothetical protein